MIYDVLVTMETCKVALAGKTTSEDFFLHVVNSKNIILRAPSIIGI